MMKRYSKSVIVLTALFYSGVAQTIRAQDIQKQYTVVNRSLSIGAEPGSVDLNEMPGVGIAWINGSTFTQGSIEFDVKGKDVLQQSFVGIAFHGGNDTTYECVYFRPFNFRAADPVRKAHAVQYIVSPKYDWPKLRAEYPGKYEQPVLPAPDPNAWFHVRIVIEHNNVMVYVNNNPQPALTVEPLVKLNGKMIGYWAGNNSGGDWKNLKIKSN